MGRRQCVYSAIIPMDLQLAPHVPCLLYKQVLIEPTWSNRFSGSPKRLVTYIWR